MFFNILKANVNERQGTFAFVLGGALNPIEEQGVSRPHPPTQEPAFIDLREDVPQSSAVQSRVFSRDPVPIRTQRCAVLCFPVMCDVVLCFALLCCDVCCTLL